MVKIHKLLVLTIILCFSFLLQASAETVEISLTLQPPSSITSNGETIFPTQSEVHQFEAGVGGTFNFVVPSGGSVKIVFFIGTTQVTLDFFIDSYEKSAIIASRPLPIGRDVVGGLIYDMRTFEETTETLTFDAPFAMTVGYLEEQLGNLNEATLGIYFWDESQSIWTAFDVDSRDTDENTITILSDHLTLFATLGETPQAVIVEEAPSTGGGGGPIQPARKIIVPSVTPLAEPVSREPIIEGAEVSMPEGIPTPTYESVEQAEDVLEKPAPALFDIEVEPAPSEPKRIKLSIFFIVGIGAAILLAIYTFYRRRKRYT